MTMLLRFAQSKTGNAATPLPLLKWRKIQGAEAKAANKASHMTQFGSRDRAPDFGLEARLEGQHTASQDPVLLGRPAVLPFSLAFSLTVPEAATDIAVPGAFAPTAASGASPEVAFPW